MLPLKLSGDSLQSNVLIVSPKADKEGGEADHMTQQKPWGWPQPVAGASVHDPEVGPKCCRVRVTTVKCGASCAPPPHTYLPGASTLLVQDIRSQKDSPSYPMAKSSSHIQPGGYHISHRTIASSPGLLKSNHIHLAAGSSTYAT